MKGQGALRRTFLYSPNLKSLPTTCSSPPVASTMRTAAVETGEQTMCLCVRRVRCAGERCCQCQHLLACLQPAAACCPERYTSKSCCHAAAAAGSSRKTTAKLPAGPRQQQTAGGDSCMPPWPAALTCLLSPAGLVEQEAVPSRAAELVPLRMRSCSKVRGRREEGKRSARGV